MTVGDLPRADLAFSSQGLDKQSLIISSATKREPVSFHLPLKSLTSSTPILFTVVPQAARNGNNNARRQGNFNALFIACAWLLRRPDHRRLSRRWRAHNRASWRRAPWTLRGFS